MKVKMPPKVHSLLKQAETFRTGALADIGGNFPVDESILKGSLIFDKA